MHGSPRGCRQRALDRKTEALLGAPLPPSFETFGLAVTAGDTVSLRQLQSALRGLLGVVESTDQAPTADAITAMQAYQKATAETLADWEQVKRTDLEQLNDLLLRAKLAEVSLEGNLPR